MVLDSLTNSANYEALNPYFKMAFDYIKKTDWSTVEPGKILLDGKNCFINVINQAGKTPEAAKFETHNNYLDIQIPLDGTELMGFIPTDELKLPDAPYNPEKRSRSSRVFGRVSILIDFILKAINMRSLVRHGPSSHSFIMRFARS